MEQQLPWLVECDKPSYQILKWVGGGGFGQVFKVVRNGQVVACKQVPAQNAQAALDEYNHLRLLRGEPHIATLHDGIEYNQSTGTLSFFMDYYKGKDLDRQVQMLRGAAQNFSEEQIVEIGYQISRALTVCHSKKILHRDLKPMNVLLREPWNPMTQRYVTNVYLADFGIASHVQTLNTRITAQRGTPGYEAPEIRGQGYQAAFSQKSDVYAFGCILYRLCTLEHPVLLDDVKPWEIPASYSMKLLSLISSMLSGDRDMRPTAFHIKEQLAAISFHMHTTSTLQCLACHTSFPSRTQLSKHLKQTKHKRPAREIKADLVEENPVDDDIGFRIRGAAGSSVEHDCSEAGTDRATNPCVVCRRNFRSRKGMFGHLYGASHCRGEKYMRKRQAKKGPGDWAL